MLCWFCFSLALALAEACGSIDEIVYEMLWCPGRSPISCLPLGVFRLFTCSGHLWLQHGFNGTGKVIDPHSGLAYPYETILLTRR
jgi:hypothetical protein